MNPTPIGSKPTLLGPRLRLRAVRMDDAAELVALDADAEVRRYVGNFSPPTLRDVREVLIPRWQAFDAQTPLVGYWVAELKQGEGEFVGWFHLRPPRPGEPGVAGDLSLGYRLRRSCWGRGLAS